MQELLHMAPNIPNRHTFAFGMAMSYMTTTFVLCKQLKDESRLPISAEDAQKQVIQEWIDGGLLNVLQSEIDAQKDGNDQINAHLRHLRNCFGHGNWSFDETKKDSDGNFTIELYDYNTAIPPAMRFHATILAPDLIDLAQKLLVETFNHF